MKTSMAILALILVGCGIEDQNNQDLMKDNYEQEIATAPPNTCLLYTSPSPRD